ncbi:MAG TPA: biotin carboxylase N-terminal domain-containing protein [Acetobacteraceae bacterium]|nr:biotin carboxylase N-terminal domain-containing protein [Acetobacteraceae bacterium]
MFRKILIANRGEIACRVITTARRLGIASVAIYSEVDKEALHVARADEAWPVGPAPARESYLAIEKIIAIARRAGAEAIHPGYGFLAENPEFAEACAAAGIVFIGPPPGAIRAMGSKASAKSLMERAGVRLVPGYHGEAQDFATLRAAVERIGYPALIKASAGGGGKGMRIVTRAEEIEDAIAGARSEAMSAFGDGHLLVEKYLPAPRHIEIQIFADAHGHIVPLFERDCSIQRRYQKVIEEAPAPGMREGLRQAMGEAACRVARAVDYVGAGTVEFIAEGEDFYFMEMNTRLQVEHPVTEMITGLDLVEWQLRVAAGEALPLAADQLSIRGHAIEARIYAEDPAQDFRPSIGTLVHLREPQAGSQVRIDAGVRQGDAITPHYDPMIAKLIVRGKDRGEATRLLAATLAQYEIVGVETNLGLLRAIAAHPDFACAKLDTGFIARHAEILLAPPVAAEEAPLLRAAAALALFADWQAETVGEAASSSDPFSPWAVADAWRMNGEGYRDLILRHEDRPETLRIHPETNGACRLDLADGPVRAEAREEAESGMALRLDGVLHRVRVVRHGDAVIVIRNGRNHVFRIVDPLTEPVGGEAASEGHKRDDRRSESRGETTIGGGTGGRGRTPPALVAPIPARIARVLAQVGAQVRRGEPLIVLEAMKTEMTLVAPFDGEIASLPYRVDEMVEEGTELVTFAVGEAAQTSRT